MSEGDLTESEWHLFTVHLSKFPRARVCPVCEHTDWAIPTGKEHGIYAGDGVTRQGGVLVVVTICTTCFYVRHYAWQGITGEARGQSRPPQSTPEEPSANTVSSKEKPNV